MKKLFSFVVIICLIIATLPGIYAEVSAAEPILVSPSDDTYVDENRNNMNYGSLITMVGKKQDTRNQYALIKFDLTDIEFVDNAKLRLYGLSGPVASIAYAYGASDDWSENDVTWLSKPTIDSVSIGETATVMGVGAGSEQYWDIDISEYIINQLAGDQVASIALQSPDYTTVKFYTKEDAEHPPLLVINEDSGDNEVPESDIRIVDQTGVDGTYSTIQAALDVVNPGDIVEIRSGTYVENLNMTRSGTEGDIITIRSEAEANVTLNGSFLIDADYVHVEDFNMVGEKADATYSSYAIKVEGQHVHVIDMDIRSYAGPAIYYTPASHFGYASGNYIYSVAQGFHVASHAIIENNEIEALHLHGNNSAAGDNFRIFGSDIIIRNNYTHGTTKGEHMGPAHVDIFQSWDDSQIEVKNILIENNLFTGWYHQGIMLENDAYGGEGGTSYISDWTVRNNVFAGHESWAISAGKAGGGIPNMLVENNVFAGNAATGAYYGVVMIGESGSGIVSNNIFINHTVSSIGAQSGATIEADYNMYWNTVLPVQPGENDIMGMDPRFVDQVGLDFHLLSDSPAINTGETRPSFTSDLEGEVRPTGSAWDRGPYEFQGVPSNIAPLISITSPSYAEVFAVDTDIQISVNARDGSAAVQQVEFYLNGESASIANNAPYTTTFTGMQEGLYTVHAVATDVEGLSSESNEVWFVVTDQETFVADEAFANIPMEAQSGQFTVGFNIVPLSDNMNGLFGFGRDLVGSFGGMAAAVRLNPEGNFDARSGSVYAADNIVPYEKGQIYTVTMAIDVVNHTYDVYVKPEGEMRQTVGTDLAFRTEQSAVTLLNSIVTIAEVGSFMAMDFTMNPEIDPDEPNDPGEEDPSEQEVSLLGLLELTKQFVSENGGNRGKEKSLTVKLDIAIKMLEQYISKIDKESGKSLTPEQAAQLIEYAEALLQ